jgi:hypothetical protein
MIGASPDVNAGGASVPPARHGHGHYLQPYTRPNRGDKLFYFVQSNGYDNSYPRFPHLAVIDGDPKYHLIMRNLVPPSGFQASPHQSTRIIAIIFREHIIARLVFIYLFYLQAFRSYMRRVFIERQPSSTGAIGKRVSDH